MEDRCWHYGGQPWAIPLLISLGLHMLGLALAGMVFEMEIRMPQPPTPIKVGFIFKPRPAPLPAPSPAIQQRELAPEPVRPKPEPVEKPSVKKSISAPRKKHTNPTIPTPPSKATAEPAGPAIASPTSIPIPPAAADATILAAPTTHPAPPREPAPAAAPPPLAEQPVYLEYLGKVRLEIDRRKRYPVMALRGGQRGVAVVDFELDSQGRLRRCELVESSGYKLLDRAAIKAVRRAAPFATLPGQIGPNLALRVPIRFELKH